MSCLNDLSSDLKYCLDYKTEGSLGSYVKVLLMSSIYGLESLFENDAEEFPYCSIFSFSFFMSCF